MPKETSKELFDELVKAGFNPIKAIIERDDLDETMTPEDLSKIMGKIEDWVVSYLKFMAMAKKESRKMIK